MKIIRLSRSFLAEFYLKRNSTYPVGRNNKQNRDIWLEQKLSSIPKGARILDAGAGELRNKPLCSHLNYVSQDYCQFKGNNLDAPGLGSKQLWDTSQIDLVCDITSIPEPDESFDVILCSEVFEHLPNPIAALKELSRLLKQGGKLILTAPFNSLTHQAPYFFHTGYSNYFYENWCEQFSLKIIELIQNGNYFEYLAQELRRVTFIGRKYAQMEMNYWQRKAIHVILGFLAACSKANQGSEEVLCFGYHLLAEKKSQQ
ncbi:MAG: class I SAM-dependent methyltransferase [Anaerolineaceae bacterium]|nr:class I SAM-dependent methyltransferase [Anaerolineaceae bacterium]